MKSRNSHLIIKRAWFLHWTMEYWSVEIKSSMCCLGVSDYYFFSNNDDTVYTYADLNIKFAMACEADVPV